jgi:hypothetical protein
MRFHQIRVHGQDASVVGGISRPGFETLASGDAQEVLFFFAGGLRRSRTR